MWSCVIEDFGMHECPFWYEWGRVGVVWGFLLSDGVVFTGRCMTPLPPKECEVAVLSTWDLRFSGA